MLLTREAITLVIALCTFVGGLIAFVWRSSAKFEAIQRRYELALIEVKHESRENTLKHENVQNQLTLLLNGYREKYEHFTDRTKKEYLQTDARLDEIEGWLTKHTTYEKRNNG